MDNCEKYNDLISLYIDGMLESDDDLMDLLEHLDECDECKALYSDLKSFSNPLKEDDIEYPEDLNEKIWEYINQNKEADIVQYKYKSRLPYLVGLAACVLVGVFVSSDEFQNRTLNSNSVVPTLSTQPEEETMSINSEAPLQSPADARSAFNLEYNQYAYVFEFVGDGQISNSLGEILYSNSDILYIKAENTLNTILKNDEILEESGFTQLAKSNSYTLDNNLDYGIYIIYLNN